MKVGDPYNFADQETFILEDPLAYSCDFLRQSSRILDVVVGVLIRDSWHLKKQSIETNQVKKIEFQLRLGHQSSDSKHTHTDHNMK